MTEKTSDSEKHRLQNLLSYGILDTEADSRFDDLARLAATITQSPVSFVSLVDQNRQWCKARIGMDISEVPRRLSFCSYAIEQNEIFIVEDMLKDERFKENELVVGEPHIRFYAGVPVVSEEGYKLGTICVIDYKPKTLTSEQMEMVKILGKQVEQLLILFKKNRELQEQQNLVVNKARLQTIGELASGVCHQINNPLAIIVGRTLIVKTKIQDAPPEFKDIAHDVDVIEKTSQRISTILKALRIYAKDMEGEPVMGSLAESVDDAVTLVKGRMSNFQLKFEYEKPEKTFPLILNKNKITQVFVNLLNNALEAVEEVEEKKISLGLKEEDSFYFVTVTDNGAGIKKEDSERIYDPFFTTKPRHFGVGLSNAQSYMKQHGGSIKLLKNSGPTIFQVKIPKLV